MLWLIKVLVLTFEIIIFSYTSTHLFWQILSFLLNHDFEKKTNVTKSLNKKPKFYFDIRTCYNRSNCLLLVTGG